MAWLKYFEPTGPVYISNEDAIATMRQACIYAVGEDRYESDEQALRDFKASHWAVDWVPQAQPDGDGHGGLVAERESD